MPKTRDILVHVYVDEAQRQRDCRRDRKRKIAKGESCLVVKTGPTNDRYSYCTENAKPMLDLAFARLKQMYSALGLSIPL